MADYWKSTGKWFCDICKCWTADNRASIDFHERGKNHQENKRRRLIEIKKNAMDKRKKDAKDEKMFEKMEKAALAAVQKDMASSKSGLGKSDMKNIVAAHSSDSSSSSNIDTYPWTAMLAPQGFTYYYNSQTGKSTWEMPEVFKKIEEQKQKEKYAVHATKTTTVKSKVKDDTSSNAAVVEEEEEKEEEPVEEHDVHPLLGGWSTVKSDPAKKKQNEEPTLDETPSETVEPKEVEKPTLTDVPRESGKKFKEKVLKTNLVSSDQPVTFKKRKSALKNVRKRNDDD